VREPAIFSTENMRGAAGGDPSRLREVRIRAVPTSRELSLPLREHSFQHWPWDGFDALGR